MWTTGFVFTLADGLCEEKFARHTITMKITILSVGNIRVRDSKILIHCPIRSVTNCNLSALTRFLESHSSLLHSEETRRPYQRPQFATCLNESQQFLLSSLSNCCRTSSAAPSTYRNQHELEET